MQLRVAVPEVVDLVRHRQHARRARGDAQLAALAGVDVDRDRAAALDRRHAHAASCSHAGKAAWSTVSKPARMAFSFAAMCCRRYGGIDWRIASTVASRPTRPVIPTYAPAMTIEPP